MVLEGSQEGKSEGQETTEETPPGDPPRDPPRDPPGDPPEEQERGSPEEGARRPPRRAGEGGLLRVSGDFFLKIQCDAEVAMAAAMRCVGGDVPYSSWKCGRRGEPSMIIYLPCLSARHTS